MIEILWFFSSSEFSIRWNVAVCTHMHVSRQLKNNLNETKYSGKSAQTSVENTYRKVSRDSIYK